MISQNIDNFFSTLNNIPFDTLMWIIWGTFGGIFAVTLIMCIASPRIRTSSKRPYLCLANAYAAVTLAAFLTSNALPQSVLAAALFWCVAYLSYGILVFIGRDKRAQPEAQIAISSLPVQQQPKAVIRPTEVPTAKSNVRLEHAISVTDKLLQKNLGKSDRQELEKLKNTLAVLQMKGTLSPTEADILNENFNALLKLMAKYNV